MRSHFRIVLGSVAGIGILMILILGLHLGGPTITKIGPFFPLSGCIISGAIIIISVWMPTRREESREAWLKDVNS